MNGAIPLNRAVKSSPIISPTRDLVDTAEKRPARYECFAGREFARIPESSPQPKRDNLFKGIAYAVLLLIAGIVFTGVIFMIIDVVG